jgi:hypothetical protein
MTRYIIYNETQDNGGGFKYLVQLDDDGIPWNDENGNEERIECGVYFVCIW